MGSDGSAGRGALADGPDALGLASPGATRLVLEAHGLDPKKRLGQHFLVGRWVLERILEWAEPTPEDIVLEVGPGIGTLTRALLAEAGAVVAVEADPALVPVLEDTCAAERDRLALIQGDALRVGPAEISRALAAIGRGDGGSAGALPNKFVANLPYNVAATLVLDILSRLPTVRRAVVMVQREVADRMVAEPGGRTYGAYTVKLALRARPLGRFEVGRREFWPPPHVDSTVLALERAPLVAPAEAAAVDRVVDGAFSQRRKTLVNALSGAGFARGAVEGALGTLGLDPKIRAERLGPEDFVRLTALLEGR